MEEIEKNIRINKLFDLYGALLTNNQQKMVAYYYQDDLSLGEIALEEGISRNAVHDTLKKSITLLEGYEEKLSLLKKKEELEAYLDEKSKGASIEVKNLIDEMRRKGI